MPDSSLTPQDTVVTLDALAAYWVTSHTTEDKVLNVTLSSLGRNGFKSHALQLNNHQVKGLEEELKVTHALPDGVAVGLGSAQKHMRTHIHTHTLTHTHIHTLTQAYTHIHTLTHTHTHHTHNIYTYTHSDTHILTTHMYTHTH